LKRILSLIVVSALPLCFSASGAEAQSVPPDFASDLQKMDARSQQEFRAAVQRGDFQTAQKIYQDHHAKAVQPAGQSSPAPAAPASRASLFENVLSGEFPAEFPTQIRQFGYDAFLRTAATFTPPSTVPVGPDYLIGPGDRFTLTLWGTTEGIFALEVTKEGNVTLPKVGVIPVAGLRFDALERTLRRHLSRYYTNFNLSVAMGELKTITVYVVGEVTNPGSYSLSSLTSVYGALFAAGGPTKKGTLRTIQVLRAGKVVRTIDLYDFLLRGDRSQDSRLQHEDTVFVPLIGQVAGISGTVYRPAIYELMGKETVADLIGMAGGIMPIALSSRLQITRFESHEKKVILDVQVPAGMQASVADRLREPVLNMDSVQVFPVYEKVWEFVNLNGAVRYPGNFQWRQDLTVREVILQGQVLPTTDLRRAEVIRLSKDFSDREVLPVDLEKLLAGDEGQNMTLKPQDQVRVYTMYRQPEKIALSGEVVRPGTYDIQNGERLSDVIARAGGFTAEAYVYGAVFKRKSVQEAEHERIRSLIARLQAGVLQTGAEGAATAVSAEEATFAKAELALNQQLLANLKALQEQQQGRVALNITGSVDEWKGTREDLLLQDGDSLAVPKRPQEVLVLGEVYSPGAVIHESGVSVKDYIGRSGGTTKYAETDDVFVIQANGYAFGKDSPEGGSIEDATLRPGDAVVVPLKVERYASMRFTKDIVDILFKTAVVVGLLVAAF
jgi:protein involved in polysaccharide export with SLBB domain